MFVVGLRLGLTGGGLGLEDLGIPDDLLDEANDRRGAGIVLVVVELNWRGLGSLRQNRLADVLVVEVLQFHEGLVQDGLRGPLVGNDRLELLVLLLALLARFLDLNLRARDLHLGGLDLLVELFHEALEAFDVGLQVLLQLALLIQRRLSAVHLRAAMVLERHLLGLLVLEVRHHLVHELLDLREGIELHCGRQCGKLRAGAGRGTHGARHRPTVPGVEQVVGVEVRRLRGPAQSGRGVEA
mmetsp:Transcript_17540/g.44115  ORF Transcript_17540/g.44115 Transcript_17540/m.44115 type:complete len:241 (+) Transcript_17540:357-1079(+)